MALVHSEIEAYLSRRLGSAVRVEHVGELGGPAKGQEALKLFGYGRPLCIDFCADGKNERVILRQIKRNGFGHERDADRVAEVWEDFRAFNRLPRHIRAKDLVTLDASGRLDSIAHAEDVLLLTEYVPGEIYTTDLVRIRDTNVCTDQDLARVRALATYAAQIHAVKHDDSLLWRRRLRDLIGDGEGIFGQTDGYPADFALANADDLRAIEEQANRWRWKLKPKAHRLSQVHGDFHPFNILFEDGENFHMLDRSRGEWGEPADDVSSMTINYLFFALQKFGKLAGPFETIFKTFFETYLNASKDAELLESIQPWYAWRVLVVASPVWYPKLEESVRRVLFTFARRVMAEDRFEWTEVNRYLK
ncbi:MAG TPA: phosphotransferase [Planctomycetota bacterium]|nr:phosphotransferase [Planctomycetota bacterium]